MKKILALDIATVTGFCYDVDGLNGVVSFKAKSNESKGIRLLKFNGWLKNEIFENITPDIVVYEKPAGGRYNAMRSGSNFEGVLIRNLEERKLQYADYSPNTIKAFARKTMHENSKKATLPLLEKKGSYGKKEMLESAKIWFGDKLTVLDDNHADALWLWSYAHTIF